MAGCLYISSSTSAGQTLKPLALIMRLSRSVMKKYPSSSTRPMSPDRKKRSPPISTKADAVASGRFQ